MKLNTAMGLPERLTLATALTASLVFLVLAWSLQTLAPTLPPLFSIAIAATLGLSATIAVVRPRLMFYGFLITCMVFPHEIEELYIPLGFMKVYPQDAMFAFFLCYSAWLWLRGRFSLHSIPFNRQMYYYLALGVWATGIGLLVTHQQYDNALGDFRRSFFYFLAYFFTLIFTWQPRDLLYIRNTLLIGSLGAITKGVLQAATGDFVTRRFGDAAHVLTHFEVTFSTFAVYYALTKISLRYNKTMLWILIAAIGGAVVVFANFRTCWVGLSVGLLTMAYLLPVKLRLRLWAMGIFAILAGAMLLSLLWNVPVAETHSTLGENIVEKANVKKTMDDQNIAWRMDSYRNALELWQKQPILGRGLGEELEFVTTTSTGGAMMATGHRVHNSYLWFLMSLGVSGFAILLYIHAKFIKTIVRAARNHDTPRDTLFIVIVCSALYATILTSACFDVYLESAPPITILSVAMATSLMAIQYANSAKKSSHAVPASQP